MNKETFIKEINKLGIKLSSEQMQQLNDYYQLLIFWNAKMNLTSITQEEDVYLKHFYDSLTIVKAIDLNNIKTILDVGSGAGFPGLVLKICFPHLKLDIIDSNNKKILFINEVINKLNLDNINLIHDRCEIYALKNRERYDLVTSRAVANLNTLIELCFPLVKVEGYFIALKGNIEQEIQTVSNELNILKGQIEQIITFNLPKEESIRNLVKIKKLEITPEKYPRAYDKIKKKPL